MKKLDYGILIFIFLIGLLVRLYRVSVPMGDFHSWRQSDTAAIARHYVQDGIDLLHPRYDDISSISTGKENPHGYRFVEFPLYNASFALLYKAAPIVSLETYGRLVSALMSLITIAVIYFFARKEVGRVVASVASFVFAVFPFFVFFTRVVLPEPTALSLTFISLFFIYQWTYRDRKNSFISYAYLISGICFFALALLVKPTAIFYGISLLYLFAVAFRKQKINAIPCILFFVLSAIPLLVWRTYIAQFPEGIPPNNWLVAYVNTYQGLQNIFLKPAFFRWIFYERIHNLILGGFASTFFFIGLLSKQTRFFLYTILASAVAYLFVFEGGNIQHEYYQILILPALAIFVGIGVHHIVSSHTTFISRFITIPFVGILLCSAIIISWYSVKNYYNYDGELVQIASIVKSLTQPEDKIVTDRIGDTTLLYLMERQGAAAIYRSPEELHVLGYSYIVTMNKENVVAYRKKHYQIVFENDTFALVRL